MERFENYTIQQGTSIKEALARLDVLARDAILFVIDPQGRLVGSLTDGDVRRGLIKGRQVEDSVDEFLQSNPQSLIKSSYTIQDVIELRKNLYKVIPVLDDEGHIINIVNFRLQESYLPIDTVVMAGGRGSRLKPLTDSTPKPLLKVGDKPIMEHNVDRLRKFGVDDFYFSVRYLGEQIEEYFGDGQSKQIQIEYIWEDQPLGTIGALSKISSFKHDYVLVTNSDLLTTLDYEDFFLNFLDMEADMSVATIPYTVSIPYAVLETVDNHVKSFKEKPDYTYYSNAGIYLIKRELLDLIPKGEFYNSTDLMEEIIAKGLKLVSYPMRSYWLDIGKHEDFKKAIEDIKHIQL